MSAKGGWAYTMGQNRDYCLLWPSVICQAIVVASYFSSYWQIVILDYLFASCLCASFFLLILQIVFPTVDLTICLSGLHFVVASFDSFFCKKSFPIIYFANFINCLSGQSFCNFVFHVMWHQNNQSDQGEVAYEIRPIFSSRFQNKPLDRKKFSHVTYVYLTYNTKVWQYRG